MDKNQNNISESKTKFNIDLADVNKYSNFYKKKYQLPNDLDNEEKLISFKNRFDLFKTISSLEDAKRLIDAVFPVNMERTVFNISDAKCVIVKKADLVKICFQSATEVIVYNFT